MINLRGFPEKTQEEKLANAVNALGGGGGVMARWEWKIGEDDKEPVKLCECCCRMLMYREVQQWMSENPGVEVTDFILKGLFNRKASPIMHQVFFNQPLFFYFFPFFL